MRPAGVSDTGAFECLLPPGTDNSDLVLVEDSPTPAVLPSYNEKRKYHKAIAATYDCLLNTQVVTKDWTDNLPFHKFAGEIRDACESYLLDVTKSMSRLDVLRHDKFSTHAIEVNVEEADTILDNCTKDFDQIGKHIYDYLPDGYRSQTPTYYIPPSPSSKRSRALTSEPSNPSAPSRPRVEESEETAPLSPHQFPYWEFGELVESNT